MRPLFIVFALQFLLLGRMQATSYAVRPWEEVAMTSEFGGVVECITAGGIVARYRVIESWKGPAVGTELNISQFTDYYGPQFPTSLVGQTFLIFAHKPVPYDDSSLIIGHTTPLWWRRIPLDLSCSWMIESNTTSRIYLGGPGNPGITFEDFKKEAIALLQSDDDTKEVILMLSTARNGLRLATHFHSGNAEDIALYEVLKKAATVKRLWETLIEQARQIVLPPRPEVSDTKATLPPPRRYDNQEQEDAARRKSVMLTMIESGGDGCKALLEKADFTNLPWEKDDLSGTLNRLRRKTSITKADVGPGDKMGIENNRQPSEKELDQAKAIMAKPWDYQTGEAFELLCRHSPETVVKFLHDWQLQKEERQNQLGYTLGSRFGHLCSKDRRAHLTSLCTAKDEWVKTAAAVYLCFDDVKAGAEHLRTLMRLDGDPGLWAAVVLTSRGEKAAMTNAIELATLPRDFSMRGVNHDNFQKRLLVLLSNSAARSSIPQPPTPSNVYADGKEAEMLRLQLTEALKAWWRTHEDKIVLHDPWLEMLEKQKVD